MVNKYDIAVVGGDMRQIYMINEFINRGYTVIYFGIQNELIDRQANYVPTLEQAVSQSELVMCPIPFTKDKTHLLINQPDMECGVDELLESLTDQHLLISASIPQTAQDYCRKHNIRFCDLMTRNDFCLLNGVSTAEGTIAEAIRQSSINLQHSNSLVLGYGRCAQILAKKLAALDARITVAARNYEVLAVASANGYATMSLDAMDDQLGQFDFVFNTIPALILTKERIVKLASNVTIIDIASTPGGVDFQAAKAAGIHAGLYLGLPGRYSPKTSGEIIVNVIEHLLAEQDV